MTTTIARILRTIGNLLFDTAERIHPIDTQPMSHRSSFTIYGANASKISDEEWAAARAAFIVSDN